MAAMTAQSQPVGITPDLMAVTVTHGGQTVEIRRDQDNSAMVDPRFARTSRPCPPFCIQPMAVAPGVETLGELEVLDHLRRQEAGEPVMVIDSRTPDWVQTGTIPGASNIPWTDLSARHGATSKEIVAILTGPFGARLGEGMDLFDVDEALVAGTMEEVIDYGPAKTLVLFCNGMWCGQSPANIRTLLRYGYPPEKLKWYRGGMQSWSNLGFTTR
jgi:rhodanese-related sulfurtransferase